MARLDLDGRTLGEFTLREKIGEGGFAAVHRAEQTALGREAVVKVLHTRLATTPEVAQRFLREARLASRIDHPFAAHVYAFGAEPDGLLWIAMELVRGTPMDKLLEDKGPIALEQLVPLFERICEVVQSAHDHGIVHRDLKPGNVMVMSRGGRLLPKLLDFGIARALDDAEPGRESDSIDTPSTSTPAATSPRVREIDPRATTAWIEVDRGGTRRGAVMGSPSYMAPEQWIDAGSVGPATDIYALGVLAFQALTGRVPYTGTLEGIRAAHLEATPPKLGGSFPPAVDAMLARALAKRPLDRYDSAADLAAAMRAAAGFEDGVLPQLSPAIRDAVIANAVQPIAEAVVALDTARNLDQAAALISDVSAVAIRWLTIVALAARSSIGPGGDLDSETVREKLRQLGRGRLDDATWLALASELTRPFVERREVYPVPELVAMLHDRGAEGDVVSAFRHVHELQDQLDRRVQRTPDERRALYGEALVALARLLAALAPLDAYTVVVPRGGRAERWRGVRRAPRVIATVAGALVDGRAALIDAEGRAVLQLAPLVQIATPAPGRDEELFVLDGKGTRTARLIAMPFGFERSDPALHDWLRDELGDLDEPAAATEPESPYRGLAPFTEDLAADYVGREREVETFVNRLIAEPLLAVVGPSGAGKSSFVQAGVLPNLPARWRAIIVRPGASPIAALEAHLDAAGVEVRGLAEDPGALADALREAAQREGATLVLVIDQLEELFTLCRDDRERAAFAAALADATRTEIDPIRVVVTLRDDFLIRVAGMPVLGERLARGLQLLAVPSPDDLERIVVEPARRAGYELEDPALATEMVDAVATQPGALALLSFTAAELWKLRDRHFRQLTRKAYAAIGGVGGALAKHAETMLSELSAEDQRLVRIAFRNLVTVEGTRQVLTVDDLHQLLAPKTERARAAAVVDRLIAARLLVTSEDAGGIARIEIIHEALLAAWPRLVEWRREDAEGARLRDQLRIAARQWDARGRPRGLLWRDDALAEYRLWRARHPGMITDVEEAFGGGSLDDEARRRRIRRTLLASTFLVLGAVAIVLYQLRERATEQSTRAIAESTRAEQEKTRAETERTRAEARENEMRVVNARSVVEVDPTTTLGWLKHYPIEGPSWNQVRELVLEAQYRGVARHVIVPDEPRWVGFAGEQYVVTAGGQSIQTWDRATGRLLGRIAHPVRLIDDSPLSYAAWPNREQIAFTDTAGDVWIATLPAGVPSKLLNEIRSQLAVSPDGNYLASVGQKVQLRAPSGVLRTLEGHRGLIHVVMFTPDSRRLVTAGADGTIRSWDVETGAGRLEATVGAPIQDLAVRLDAIVYGIEGKTVLLTGGTKRILHEGSALYSIATADGFFASSRTEAHVWTPSGVEVPIPKTSGELSPGAVNARVAVLTTGAGPIAVDLAGGHTRRLLGHRTALAAAVSPDGSGVAVIGGDDRVRVWERSGSRSWILQGHAAEVSEIAFAPDGHSVITAGMDREVRVWRFETGETQILGGHDNGVYRIEYSPDGRLAAALTWGTVARVWDLATGTARTFDHQIAATEMRFDGAQLLIATERGIVAWNVVTKTQRLFAQPDAMCVELSPDRRTVAAGSKNGQIMLWDLETGSSRLLGTQPAEVVELRFLAGGQLVSRTGRAARKHLVTVWESDGASRVLMESPLPLRTVAVSTAHQRVAVGGGDGEIHVFDLRRRTTRVLHGHDKQIRALVFSADGALLASGSQDATARLWVIETGASQLLHRFEQAVRSVAFSRDGKWVGSASNDHTARVDGVRVERSLAVGTQAVADRIDQLTTVTIDRNRLIQGRNEGATTGP